MSKAVKEQLAREGIPMDLWAKDHWSLLAYVEAVCVDAPAANRGTGELDTRRMRTHSQRPFPNAERWKSGYTSRIKVEVLDYDHDDWDCLDDLEDAGLVVVISMANGYVTLTDLGRKYAHALRAHKLTGANFADFDHTRVTP